MSDPIVLVIRWGEDDPRLAKPEELVQIARDRLPDVDGKVLETVVKALVAIGSDQEDADV